MHRQKRTTLKCCVTQLHIKSKLGQFSVFTFKTEATHKASVTRKVDAKASNEEEKKDGETGELDPGFPSLRSLVPQQGEANEKSSEEAK